jgi:predicted nucleic acid-binding protein
MSFVLDSNILLRMAQPIHPHHAAATNATTSLIRQGETVYLIPQNLYEFWAVATRAVQFNGLGLSVSAAQKEILRLKSLFSFLPDAPTIYLEWERLVTTHTVSGRDSHDTRIVAAMNVHGISHLLTFNKADFIRYPGITVLLPSEIVTA